MAYHCSICDTRRYCGPTKILVLDGNWYEFCEHCGDRHYLTNRETGEEMTIANVFLSGKGEPLRPEKGFKPSLVEEEVKYLREAELQHYMHLGAPDRKTALRWILQSNYDCSKREYERILWNRATDKLREEKWEREGSYPRWHERYKAA